MSLAAEGPHPQLLCEVASDRAPSWGNVERQPPSGASSTRCRASAPQWRVIDALVNHPPRSDNDIAIADGLSVTGGDSAQVPRGDSQHLRRRWPPLGHSQHLRRRWPPLGHSQHLRRRRPPLGHSQHLRRRRSMRQPARRPTRELCRDPSGAHLRGTPPGGPPGARGARGGAGKSGGAGGPPRGAPGPPRGPPGTPRPGAPNRTPRGPPSGPPKKRPKNGPKMAQNEK